MRLFQPLSSLSHPAKQPAITAGILLTALLAGASIGRPGRAADVEEFRKPITAYFAGLEAQNLDQALAPWSPQSPYYKAQRQSLAEQLKSPGEVRLRNVQWGRTWEDPRGAWARVTFDQGSGADPTQRRTFQLVSEGGEWRIWRNSLSERILAEGLLQAPGKEQRETLLRQDPDLVSVNLVRQLRVAIGELSARRAVEEQLAQYAVALELAEQVKDVREIGRTYVARGGVLYKNRRNAEAITDLARAVELLQSSDDVEGTAVAQFNLGMTYAAENEYPKALSFFEASAANAEKAGATRRVAEARYWIGYSKHSQLDHAGALPAYQASAELFRGLKDLPGEARGLMKAGDILKVLHRDEEALALWERAADLYRDAGQPRQEIEALTALGITQGALGSYVASYQSQMRRLKVAAGLNDARLVADALSSVALSLGTLGLSQAEAEFLEKEVPLRRKIQDGAGEARALRDLGDVYRDLYRFADATEQYRLSLETSRRIQDREQEARTLAAVSRLTGELGDFVHASEHGEHAVRLYRELGLKSAEADALRELGKQYRAQGRHAEALAQFDASFKLDQEAGDVMGSIRDLDETAQDHLLTGKFKAALTIYEGSLKAYRNLKLRMGEADIHNKLGATLKLLGRYTEAESAYQQSLQISKELSLEAGVEQARANLAGLYATIGRYAEAEQGFHEALASFRKLRSRSGEATILSNLGKLYSSKGELNRAQEQFEAALAIYRELKDGPSVAQELYNLADLNADRARYAEALAGFSEALKTFRTAGRRLDEATTLSAQANVYHRLGQSAEALALYEQSRQIRSQIGDRAGFAKVGASIAGLHHEAGRDQEALQGYTEVLATLRDLGEKPAEATLLNNLSVVLRALGRNKEARTRLQEALTVTRSLGRRSDEALALGNLAYILQVEGRNTEAESTYREALKIADEAGLPEVSFRCWFGMGLLHRQQKQWRIAARDLAKATGLIDRIRGDVREQSLQTAFLEQYVSPYQYQAECLLEAGEPAAAYLAAERARARALVDVLRNGKVRITRSLSPTERETEEKLTGQVAALAAELQDARFLPTDQQLARETQLTQSREALEQYRRQLFLTHPQLSSQRGDFAPATLTQLNASLFRQEPGLCILSYLVGTRETLLFAITRGKTPTGPAALSVYRIPVARKDLEERTQSFWMECSQAGGQYRSPGQRLFQDLIHPAAKDLAGKTQVVVVPDGPLHTLPFQALVDPQGKHLIERVALSYTPSVSALVAMTRLAEQRRPAQRETLPLLAFGRPKLDASLSDLPATEAEVRSLSRLFGKGSEAVTGAEASEERFKASAARARYLHLATHGLVNEKAPMYSALALAHGTAEDGRLEARELVDLDLQADLVVLSACETALGKTVRGEGVLGLTWSLFVAGTPSTVVSHWQVEDETTATLMTQFYRKLAPATGTRPAAPLSKAGALRAAQLAVLRDGKHAHPAYWAPFVLVGDWRSSAPR